LVELPTEKSRPFAEVPIFGPKVKSLLPCGLVAIFALYPRLFPKPPEIPPITLTEPAPPLLIYAFG
jgi:hypothetical protein